MYKEKEDEDEGRHWSNTAKNYGIPRIVGLTTKKTRKSLIYLLNAFSLPLSLSLSSTIYLSSIISGSQVSRCTGSLRIV